ncbi:MAG TPA: carbon starvation CstA family protein [Vicinamibacteria bacterium]|nr:carbon starvation CstA family protein [Vicinamibacteria bacterium]
MQRLLTLVLWAAVALAGAGALAAIALSRGEPVNGVFFVVAAAGTYLVAYRFYSAFVAARVLALDPGRATPAERLDDGRDYVPTNRWIVLGHHFAAIAGPGPLVGPTLAAQFGYLPGTLWLIAGAVLGGCVQDLVVLAFSLRRDGQSLGEMARREVSRRGGMIAMASVLAIMVILLAAVALVVVNALKQSPWGAFTLGATIPAAMLMGLYLRFWRPGRVLEASLGGIVLVTLAVLGGQWVAHHPHWAPFFTFTGPALAVAVIVYGFAASALPVWLLLAPRDYLSAFIKVAVVLALAAGIVAVRPTIQMPALTRFVDGSGPVFAGTIFPFCFITIACGAVSGFHALIASGTTPRLLTRESDARLVGYGSMLMESFVGVMAMVAACALDPGVYFAVNAPAGVVGASGAAAATTISGWGFHLDPATMDALARSVGEQTLWNRTGGAPSLALGMAHIFSGSIGGERLLGIWYHFAIMFEALFILTVLDAGTRVGRFMIQEILGHAWSPLGRRGSWPATLLTSGLIVAAWGYFLWRGVLDPLGGINTLWPLFGIANQILASVALVVATTILMKMGRRRYLWVTLLPAAWLVAATLTASWQKTFDADPRLGFLAQARLLDERADSGALPSEKAAETRRIAFNNRLDAGVTLLFAALVVLLIAEAALEWYRILSGRKQSVVHEAPYVRSRWLEASP